MREESRKISWERFSLNANGSETKEFERLAYLLFCAETGNRVGLFRFANHPGIETSPLTFNDKETGFQSKFYTTSLSSNKDDIIDSLKKAKEYHPNLQVWYLYCNQEIGPSYANSSSSRTNNADLRPNYVKKIEKEASKLGVEDFQAILNFSLPYLKMITYMTYFSVRTHLLLSLSMTSTSITRFFSML